MSKKGWLITVLVAILVLIVLAAGGYGLYRLGYMHGARALVTDNDLPGRFIDQPFFRHPGFGMRGFDRGLMPMNRGNFGFPLWGTLLRIGIGVIFVGLLVLIVVLLAQRRGSPAAVQNLPAREIKESDQPDQTES